MGGGGGGGGGIFVNFSEKYIKRKFHPYKHFHYNIQLNYKLIYVHGHLNLKSAYSLFVGFSFTVQV